MRSIYDIDRDIEDILANADDETGEIDAEAFEKLEGERKKKIGNTFLYIKNLKAEAEMLAKEIENLEKRRASAMAKAERIRLFIQGYLNGEKFKNEFVSVSYIKTESVEIDDFSKVGTEYLKFTPTVNRVAVKKAIKEGKPVEGCHIEEHTTMVIK